MSLTNLTYSSVNVNSPKLYEYIVSHLYECVSNTRVRNTHEGVQYDTSYTEDALDEFLTRCISEDKITHFDVSVRPATTKNGTPVSGIDVIVEFRQTNCYNVTTIRAHMRPAR